MPRQTGNPWRYAGRANSANCVNVLLSDNSKLERPNYLLAQFDAEVFGGQAELMMFVSDANEWIQGDPFKLHSFTPLVSKIISPGDQTHLWMPVDGARIDAMMSCTQPYGLRFQCGARYLDNTSTLEWHSARMLSRY